MQYVSGGAKRFFELGKVIRQFMKDKEKEITERAFFSMLSL